MGAYIYKAVWCSFPDMALKRAQERHRRGEIEVKELGMALRATIRAKIIALYSHRLFSAFPQEISDPSFWPKQSLPDEDENGPEYNSIMFSSYFTSRALAIILDKEIMDCLLFQFADTSVQQELNTNAHQSGIDSQNEADTRDLLTSASCILGDHLGVKSKLATFHKIHDIISSKPIDAEQCPLESEIVIAVAQYQSDDDDNGIDYHDSDSEAATPGNGSGPDECQTDPPGTKRRRIGS